MEEFKGTPGKWGFTHNHASCRDTACINITSTESLHEVAYLQSTPSSIGRYEQTSFERTIANAHLISAAPELLEAMQISLAAMNEMGDILNFHDMADSETVEKLSPAFEMARAAIAKALGKE
ncbi:TPA: hypothetical protein ACJ2WV_001823 [Kluyvera georgiana]